MPDLDPVTEFGAEPVVAPPAPLPAPPAPPAVTPAQLAEVRGELDAKLKELDGLKGQGAILDKLRDVFAPGSAEDPRDAFVKKEIRRLVPELDDLDKIKQLLPVVLETLGAQAEDKLAEKAGSAIEHMHGMMKTAGLDPNDQEASDYMEEVLTRVIKGDPAIKQLWNRGNIKQAVTKAFDKASGKLFAPVRAATKRSAVNTIIESPRAIPRTAAPSSAPAGTRAVDIQDTSREGRGKVHDAAFDRLQELLDR